MLSESATQAHWATGYNTLSVLRVQLFPTRGLSLVPTVLSEHTFPLDFHPSVIRLDISSSQRLSIIKFPPLPIISIIGLSFIAQIFVEDHHIPINIQLLHDHVIVLHMPSWGLYSDEEINKT